MKFTKIVCTIGPASDTLSMIRRLIRAGMNVARLNFSHGTYKHHAFLIRNIRKAGALEEQPIALLQDLQGPRIRIGEVPDAGVPLKNGERVTLVPQHAYNEKAKIKLLPYHYSRLAQEVEINQHVLIADGVIDLRILRISGPDIICSVSVGGIVKSHKGINVPGAVFSVAAVTQKDKKDLEFGVQHKVDYIALSFVRTPEHVKTARKLLMRFSKKYPHAARIGIIAKIERPEAVHDFEKILAVVDGVMIARGDLGIEMQPEKVPVIQKALIKKCIAAHKPVIVATQMMESMITSRRATRAEVSDVANAVIDHADAVMLSGESATGQYPYETVKLMSRTIHEAEKSTYDDYVCPFIRKEVSPKAMIAHAVTDIALTKKLECIVVEDDDSELIRLVASHRPEVPIYGFSSSVIVRQQLNLVRGVRMYKPPKNIVRFLKNQKFVHSGDLYAIVEADEVELQQV